MRHIKKILICLILPAVIFTSGGFFSFTRASADTKNAMPRGVRLPIVMYHSTYKSCPGKYCMTPAALEKDFVYLIENGYTPIFFADVLAYIENAVPLPDKPVMLTFDDGYANNYQYAYPLIKKHKIKCIMSVVGKLTDDNYNANGEKCETCSHMTYEQIKELHDSKLVEIQHHTYDMHHTGGKKPGLKKRRGESPEDYEARIGADVIKLQEKLEINCGFKCTAMAYPYGIYCAETITALKKLGLKGGFTCTEGINYITGETNLFKLKRYNRAYGTSSAQFFKKLEK